MRTILSPQQVPSGTAPRVVYPSPSIASAPANGRVLLMSKTDMNGLGPDLPCQSRRLSASDAVTQALPLFPLSTWNRRRRS